MVKRCRIEKAFAYENSSDRKGSRQCCLFVLQPLKVLQTACRR
jgi:hypothetical protein